MIAVIIVGLSTMVNAVRKTNEEQRTRSKCRCRDSSAYPVIIHPLYVSCRISVARRLIHILFRPGRGSTILFAKRDRTRELTSSHAKTRRSKPQNTSEHRTPSGSLKSFPRFREVEVEQKFRKW
ncbi:uncharacterized protein LOC112688573 [Sipha flava]|uniref:Uncharacterized protein LOC112688573 n=1 Tax=Sipha flava TaxID=143950 RepID=A0A8B8G309_9HEMI|nr:uncharacterized protein LOC112688573 [Sipha flava]